MFVDLHIHTRFSDGQNTPAAMINAAIRKGIKCIAFADHNDCRAYRKGIKYIKERKLEKTIWLLPGIEFTCVEHPHLISIFYQKHVVIVGISQKQIEKMVRLYKKQGRFFLLSEIFEWAEKHKGLVIVPHPHIFGGIGSMNLQEIMKYLKYIHAIEEHNGSYRQGYPQFIYDWYHKSRKEIAKICHLPTMANSDAHMNFIVGRYFDTEILGEPKNREQVLEFVKKGLCQPHLRPGYFQKIIKKSKAIMKSMLYSK